MVRVRRFVQRHGVWLLAMSAVVMVVVAITGWWGLIVYAVLNASGTIVALSGQSATKRTRLSDPVRQLLTVALVPVGFVAVLTRPAGTSPTDAITGAEETRNDVSRANGLPIGGGGGSF